MRQSDLMRSCSKLKFNISDFSFGINVTENRFFVFFQLISSNIKNIIVVKSEHYIKYFTNSKFMVMEPEELSFFQKLNFSYIEKGLASH